MPKIAIMALTLAAMGAPLAARADGPAGDACAARLTADGKAIYAATVAARPTTETLRAAIEHETKGLAMGGKIARGSARENATAAGECMKASLQ